MHERFLGPARERQVIRERLRAYRSAPPEGVTGGRGRPLTSCLVGCASIDGALFSRGFWQSFEAIRTAHSGMRVLDPTRFLVDAPQEGTGGFHGARSRGFDPFAEVGYAETLDEALAPSRALRTLELLRSYLHDCIHAATFKSYRLARTALALKHGGVYRYQYGINFRSPAGAPYSPSDATDRVPSSINLNLLMDGVTVLLVAQAIAPQVAAYAERASTPFERAVLADVMAQAPSDPAAWPAAARFHAAVVAPTRRFIDRWGGSFFERLVAEAMFTGRIGPLATHLDDGSGPGRTWTRRFKSDRWGHLVQPQPHRP